MGGLRWFTNMLITVFVTMIFIYIIKKGANRFNVPVVKDIANEV